LKKGAERRFRFERAAPNAQWSETTPVPFFTYRKILFTSNFQPEHKHEFLLQ
jgi:hypothetical protein